jgi:hypothetical protein
MQLIQPYVQKSRSSNLPRKSASVSRRPPVWIQSSVSGKSGARTEGESMARKEYRNRMKCHQAARAACAADAPAGLDVARQGVILARMPGYAGEMPTMESLRAFVEVAGVDVAALQFPAW